MTKHGCVPKFFIYQKKVMGQIWPGGHSLPTHGAEYSGYPIWMDPFSHLLEDNGTHFPSWEVESPPSLTSPIATKQQVPSKTIFQPHQLLPFSQGQMIMSQF